MKKIVALLFALIIVVVLYGCGKSEAVLGVERAIEALGEHVALEDEDAVKAARAAYDQLEKKDQESVENHQKLIDAESAIKLLEEQRKLEEEEQKKQQEWSKLFDDEMAFLAQIVDDCDLIIDLYNRISSAAASAPSYFGKMGETNVNEYYSTIRYFNGTKTIQQFQTYYGSSSGLGAPYWQKKLYWAAVIVYPEQYKFSKYAHLPKDDAYLATKAEVTDVETIVSRCEAYNTIIDTLSVKNSLAFEGIKELKEKGGGSKEKVIDALYNYYLSIDSAVNYTLNPSGSLSNVVSGYSDVKTAIGQAKKTLDIVG